MAWVLAIVAGLFGAFGDSEMTRFLLYFAVSWLLVKYFQRGAIVIPAQEPVRRTPDFQEATTFRETPAAAVTPAAPVASESPVTPQEAPWRDPEWTPPPDFRIAIDKAAPPSTPTPASPVFEDRTPPTPREPNPVLVAISRFFTTGNVFAKVGGLLLFVGVAFLIKFVSDLGLFPIEGRLIGAALGANLLIGFGWRLREKRRSYALILQGIGFGILYLTVFGAYGQWHLLPATLAFGMLVGATVLFSLLAVLQDAPALAALAVTGGFLAPLLISTGSGNHVALFSYYAVLNVAVLLTTWSKPWRALHLIGFVFTYGVGFLWGSQYFTPEKFLSVEPFLVFHFLLYVTVALRFARLHRGQVRGLAVDGMLVFGVPMATFALQSLMLKDSRYGIALTAAALGLFYLSLATVLFRRKNPEARALVESLLTAGLVFNTLAVPFALSHLWTSAVWALEGAFLVWYGARQQRKTIRAFGFLLQALGYIAYILKSPNLENLAPWVNPVFLGALMLFAAGVFTSYQLFKKRASFTETEKGFLMPILVASFVWILLGLYREAFVSAFYWVGGESIGFDALTQSLRLGFFGVVVIALHFIARALAWPALAMIRFALFLGLAFALPILGHSRPEGYLPYLNPWFLSAFVFAVAALISGASLFATSRFAARLFLILGWGLWTVVHFSELKFALPSLSDEMRVSIFIVILSASAWLFYGLARRFRNSGLGEFRLALTGFGAAYLCVQMVANQLPFERGGWVAWIALLATHYFLLWKSEPAGTPIHRYSHFTGLWLLTAMVAWLGFRVGEVHVDSSSAWKEVFLLMLPVAVVAAVLRWPGQRFPVGRDREAYVTWGLLPHVIGLTFLSQYWNLTNAGDPTPLPYLPGVNPLGLAIGVCLLTLVYLHRAAKSSPWAQKPRAFAALVGGFAFLWLTMGVVRAVHHYAGIAWDPDVLFASRQLQTSLSIFWGLMGLATMVVGHRKGIRGLWIFGCCLMVLVVAKLFVIDLKERGTLERIISFIGTGVLLLLTGYFAPIPPSTKKVESAQ